MKRAILTALLACSIAAVAVSCSTPDPVADQVPYPITNLVDDARTTVLPPDWGTP